MSDRRNHPRVTLRLCARVRFTSWDVLELIYTVNISRGGMYLELSHQTKVGEELKVRLELPSGQQLELDAVVRRVAEPPAKGPERVPLYHVGIEFRDLGDTKRAMIEDMIRKHLGRP